MMQAINTLTAISFCISTSFAQQFDNGIGKPTPDGGYYTHANYRNGGFLHQCSGGLGPLPARSEVRHVHLNFYRVGGVNAHCGERFRHRLTDQLKFILGQGQWLSPWCHWPSWVSGIDDGGREITQLLAVGGLCFSN